VFYLRYPLPNTLDEPRKHVTSQYTVSWLRIESGTYRPQSKNAQRSVVVFHMHEA